MLGETIERDEPESTLETTTSVPDMFTVEDDPATDVLGESIDNPVDAAQGDVSPVAQETLPRTGLDDPLHLAALAALSFLSGVAILRRHQLVRTDGPYQIWCARS